MALAVFEAVEDGGRLVPEVRAFVADELRRLGRDGLIDDAILVASELATNALLHAGGIAAVGVADRGETVRIEVHDRTRVPPIMARQSTEAMTGRGLRMVSAISSEWGAEPTPEGKLVWAALAEGGSSTLQFCTAIFGVLTPGRPATVMLAGGGHPSPMVRGAGREVEEIPVGGSLLGVFDTVGFGSATVTLGPGDALVLYTDGVIEARRGDVMFGTDGVRAAIRSAPAGAGPLAKHIEAAVLEHTGGVVSDDVAVLVIQVQAD